MSEDSFKLSNLIAKYSSQPVGVLGSEESHSEKKIQLYSEVKRNRDSLRRDEEELDQCFELLLDKPEPIKKSSMKVQEREEKGSARKIFTPVKSKKQKRIKKPKLEFYDPFDSLKFFNADKSRILKQLSEAEADEEKLNDQALKLGLKPLKALGMAKGKREIEGFINYLTTGQLPTVYKQKLEALLVD